MMPTDPTIRQRMSRQEFGAAYSSSQRLSDTIGNTPPPGCQSPTMTPTGPPPPVGVICLRQAHGNLSQITVYQAPAPIFRLLSRQLRLIFKRSMHLPHRCHATYALAPRNRPSYIPIIDRATRSSSQRSPMGLATSPPPKLPIKTSNARRISSPGGRCFCAAPISPHACPLFHGKLPGIWSGFCRNFRLTCTKRIGAIRQCLCNFPRCSVYS